MRLSWVRRSVYLTNIAVWANLEIEHRDIGALCCVQTNTTGYQFALDLAIPHMAMTPESAELRIVQVRLTELMGSPPAAERLEVDGRADMGSVAAGPIDPAQRHGEGDSDQTDADDERLVHPGDLGFEGRLTMRPDPDRVRRLMIVTSSWNVTAKSDSLPSSGDAPRADRASGPVGYGSGSDLLNASHEVLSDD